MFRTIFNLSTGDRSEIPLTEQEIVEIQSRSPEPVLPNWQSLYSSLLAGNLNPVFNSVTRQAIANPAIAVGLIHVNSAITQVKVEQALAEALNVLQLSGFTFTNEYKDLWNSEIAEFNFSDLAKLK